MSKLLLVSLVHNRKSLVGHAIQSAVNQTLSKDKWVHLVIDNKSDDGADKVAELFAKKYNNIKYVGMDSNLGQMPAYNWALNEWIPKNMKDAKVMVHLDSDDMLLPNALFEVERAFDSNKTIGQTYSDFHIIDGFGKIKIKNHPKAKQVDPKIELSEQGQKILRSWEIKFNVIGHLRAFRISALNEINGFDETYKYATDVNMACRMLSSQNKVMKIPKTLYLWRDHGKDQVQGSISEEQTKCWKNITKFYSDAWKKAGLI